MYKDSYKIIDNLINRGYLSNDKKLIYNYGFFILIGYLISLMILLISGFINKIYLEPLIFYVCTMSFRVNIGGFHFSSSELCALITYTVMALVPFLLKHLSIDIHFILVGIFLIGIYIWIIAPLDSPSKILSFIAKNKLKSKIKILLMLWSCFTILLYNLYMIRFLLSVFLAYFLCLILLVTAQIFYKR